MLESKEHRETIHRVVSQTLKIEASLSPTYPSETLENLASLGHASVPSIETKGANSCRGVGHGDRFQRDARSPRWLVW